MARGGRDDDGSSVVLDLEGLPTTWRTSQARWMPWVWGSYAGLAALQVLLVVTDDGDLDVTRLLLYVFQLVLGLVGVAVGRSSAVRLGATGFRVGSTPTGGRLRPWSRVAEVRPPGPWTKHAEIRGTRGADVPVALVGMTAEQATDLQRRLLEARARVGQGA
ncbi:hypothetical protein WDZ17_07915 [Pseudokineococcus basanitobsidens]|uniref:PH domain-containing protein n=1 Tax=Pseudokineococcus basanitobsidens TaxID=1926649 RepID=A0ABU8RJD8_9ACTN